MAHRQGRSVFVHAYPRFRFGRWESVCQHWRSHPGQMQLFVRSFSDGDRQALISVFYFPRTEKGKKMTAKKTVNEQTSARVASTAAKLLSNPRTPAAVKSVAASALTQKVGTTKAKSK